jgi:cytochrome c-type biogenesis protein
MTLLTDFLTSFTLGLLTPLTAVCVLPLYPAFLSFLANQFENEKSKKQYAFFGLLITIGVIVFMLLLGIIFTTILQSSLTNAIGIISPIAFGILAIISLLLIFNIDLSSFIPKFQVPMSKSPTKSALLYGFFFGSIVIPCNPGFIAAFLSRSLLITSPISSMLNFLFFGLGLGFPLLLFSLISVNYSQSIIRFLTHHKRTINFLAGLVMLGISIYYLFFVFSIFG